ncbi:19467_t:CDS:1 [Cetraspora pellucida]|uniref:19467_t:CDS:1 n=1 Tax=Cetraspora pellucida TaxID=1433469 RepID=A0A9N9F6E0_9GLOM|nr:19467_t:CDS:1 [Cetraspora pellucida]
MPKTKPVSVKTIKLKRRKNIHYFETLEFKEKLKLSIEKNFSDFFSNRNDLNFKLALEQLLTPCKKTKKNQDKTPKPQNAFILYRKDIQSEIIKENPNKNLVQISKIIANRWDNAPDETKNQYTILADLCQRVHRDIFPDYKFMSGSEESKKKEPSMKPDELIKPWSILPSTITFSEPKSSQNGKNNPVNSDFSQGNSQGSYESVDMQQEAQFVTESQYLSPNLELGESFQMNEQIESNHLTYLNYEMQSTENLPFNSIENVIMNTTLLQGFNNNSIATLNPNSFILDTTLTFCSLEPTYEQLFNIFAFNNLDNLNALNNMDNLNYLNHLNGLINSLNIGYST